MNCEFCGRGYKRESCYRKHILTCRLLQDGSLEEKRRLPSQVELYAILVVLAREHEKLKSEVKELKRDLKQKQKINVLEWLRANKVPNQDYFDWVNRIELDLSHFDMAIAASNYTLGLTSIIRTFIGKDSVPPIVGFDQQAGVLFVFSEKVWRRMQQGDLKILVNKLGKQLIVLLSDWEAIYSKRLNSEEYTARYLKNVQIIMGGGFTFDEMCLRLQKYLYDIVKMNLRNVVEYEFTF